MNNWRSTTINYATENAVLSLCSMNIAKNHWVTLKCSVRHIFHYTYWCLVTIAILEQFLQHFTSTRLQSTDHLRRVKYHLRRTQIYLRGLHITKNTYYCPLVPLISRPPQATTGTVNWNHLYNPEVDALGKVYGKRQDDWTTRDRTTTHLLDPLQPKVDPVQDWLPRTGKSPVACQKCEKLFTNPVLVINIHEFALNPVFAPCKNSHLNTGSHIGFLYMPSTELPATGNLENPADFELFHHD